MNWWTIASEQPVFDFTVGIHTVKIGACTIVYQVEADNVVNLASVRVPQKQRGTGAAKMALEYFTKAMDQYGLHSKLLASPLDKRTRTHKLVGLYGRYGYEYKGRIGNMAGDPEMVRRPNTTQM